MKSINLYVYQPHHIIQVIIFGGQGEKCDDSPIFFVL